MLGVARRLFVMPRAAFVSGCLAVFFTLAGCGGDDGGDAGLRDATDVVSERERSGDVAEPGETVDLGELQVTVTMIEPVADFDPGEAWQRAFRVTIRSENPTGEDMTNPDVGVSCEGVEEHGSSYADSTWSVADELPARSFREGVLLLGYPEDEDGRPLPCANPMLIVNPVMWVTEAGEDPPVARWVITEEPPAAR